MFRLKLLISFSLLVNCRVKLTGTSREECAGSTTPVLKPGGSIAPSSRLFRLARVPSTRGEISCWHTFWHARWDTTIVMAVYNNNDILMVHYEDLPDRDKGVISKAIEEFQNKCLLSYTKTRDNTIVQKISTTQSSVAWADRCRWDWRHVFLHGSYKQVCSWCHIEP